ncbi:hypothetical protein HNR48_001501 [Pseudoteredinibacter isoporae]|uniref:Uncharacterized protein n=1 Tax=Pseudoteredinibacter isoporae TaxID=570281 RepID=A0A7X0MVC4_9GAMM|nr:hypothetical protein [Pseudoteredinibacter isoporae]
MEAAHAFIACSVSNNAHKPEEKEISFAYMTQKIHAKQGFRRR